MQFITDVTPKKTWDISQIIQVGREDNLIHVNGVVHSIRAIGSIAFIFLRKREGLLQCVWQEYLNVYMKRDRFFGQKNMTQKGT